MTICLFYFASQFKCLSYVMLGFLFFLTEEVLAFLRSPVHQGFRLGLVSMSKTFFSGSLTFKTKLSSRVHPRQDYFQARLLFLS
jgi:hypothetical protein